MVEKFLQFCDAAHINSGKFRKSLFTISCNSFNVRKKTILLNILNIKFLTSGNLLQIIQYNFFQFLVDLNRKILSKGSGEEKIFFPDTNFI